MDSTKRLARRAGLIYLLLAVSAPFGLLYVPGKIFVTGDAAATAANLRASEALVRWGIASELFHQVVVIFLVLVLYRLFKPVSEGLAKQLVVLGALVSVPIMFANVLNHVAALYLVSGAASLSAVAQPQLDALAYLFLYLHGKGVTVTSIFWGLWLFPFGILVIRSGFIPAILGVLLLVAGAAYLASAFATLIVPQYAAAVGRVALPLEMGEIPIVFWLAIWGARGKPATDPAGP